MCPAGGGYLSPPESLLGTSQQEGPCCGVPQEPVPSWWAWSKCLGACRGWAELEPLAVTRLFSPRSSPTRTWPC